MDWDIVIGLEVHTQLATASKIFSGAATQYGAEPNTQACAVDLGLPGVLPVLNQHAVELAIKFGLAVGASIPNRSVFARKNYFYPDLPKGYQISQHEFPIVQGGEVKIRLSDGREKSIRLHHAHLEEDAGKSVHEGHGTYSGIDLNRAGTPLLEIVSEPDMRSAEEAVAFLKELHLLVRHLGISDGNMQEGAFRCDVNVSVKPAGSEKLGTRTECKNLNSFRFVEKAIAYEVERQIQLLESAQQVEQETRLYDANKDVTRGMRSKEDALDYRYFPDPDLLPVEIPAEQVQAIQDTLPELPHAIRLRLETACGLSSDDAATLVTNPDLLRYFEAVVQSGTEAKLAANWILSELLGRLNKAELEIVSCPVSSAQLAQLIARISDNTLSSKTAKQVFDCLWSEGGEVDAIIQEQGLEQMNDTGAIEQIIDQLIADNLDQVEQYRAGKTKVLGFFVGKVMQQTQGKANPQQVNQLLLKKLQ